MREMKCKRCGEDEDRINGFCSETCQDSWYLEEEIRDKDKRIAELEAENPMHYYCDACKDWSKYKECPECKLMKLCLDDKHQALYIRNKELEAENERLKHALECVRDSGGCAGIIRVIAVEALSK